LTLSDSATSEFIVDTHPLIWHLTADARLGQQAKLILSNPASLLVFPLVVIHEAVYVAQRRPLNISGADILSYIKATRNVRVHPFTLQVLEQILQLPPGLEMHDLQIIATAQVRAARGASVVIVTKDRKISASGLVATVW
jgi:PIN domain nuclease of toxin-antitoxin system